jgi:hypothetical protein
MMPPHKGKCLSAKGPGVEEFSSSAASPLLFSKWNDTRFLRLKPFFGFVRTRHPRGLALVSDE